MPSKSNGQTHTFIALLKQGEGWQLHKEYGRTALFCCIGDDNLRRG